MLALALLPILCSSCIGIIAFRELDKEKHASYVEELRFYQLPSIIKEISLSNHLSNDSLFIVNDNFDIKRTPIKVVNRSIDGPNSSNNFLLKHGDHFKINGKKFYLGFSANPKIYYNGHLFYTKTFNLDLSPKTLEEISRIPYWAPSDHLDSVVFYKVDLSKWID